MGSAVAESSEALFMILNELKPNGFSGLGAHLPNVAEEQVGEHDPEDSELVAEAGCHPEVHPGAEVLGLEQGQEDQCRYGGHGPHGHDP